MVSDHNFYNIYYVCVLFMLDVSYSIIIWSDVARTYIVKYNSEKNILNIFKVTKQFLLFHLLFIIFLSATKSGF